MESTRKLANVRIHVERVIGSLRQKYSILESTVPLHFMKKDDNDGTTFDKIVFVCCALVNCCPSMVLSDDEDSHIEVDEAGCTENYEDSLISPE